MVGSDAESGPGVGLVGSVTGRPGACNGKMA